MAVPPNVRQTYVGILRWEEYRGREYSSRNSYDDEESGEIAR